MNARRSLFRLFAIALLVLATATPALAGDDGFSASFKADFERSSGKLVDLAEAIPADKYGWRPAEGVRSVSEALVHVAGANFFLASALGVAPPENLSRDMEQTITGKDEVLELLQKSIENVAAAADGEHDLDEEIEVFGQTMKKRDVFFIIAGHCHEHLGQTIAYARSNDVAPPWSQPPPAAEEEGSGK